MVDLRIVGGDAALDLVNTVEPRISGVAPERDHLPDAPALLRWAERAAVLDTAEAERVRAAWEVRAGLAEAEHASVLALRTAMGAAVDAARADDRGASAREGLDLIVQHAAGALSRTTLTPDPDHVHPVRRRDGAAPGRLISDRLALRALDLLQTSDLRRLKACPPEDGGCGWVFLDTSKNGTRRWCSMEDCGAHAKSRRLTDRRRELRRAGRQAPVGR